MNDLFLIDMRPRAGVFKAKRAVQQLSDRLYFCLDLNSLLITFNSLSANKIKIEISAEWWVVKQHYIYIARLSQPQRVNQNKHTQNAAAAH